MAQRTRGRNLHAVQEPVNTPYEDLMAELGREPDSTGKPSGSDNVFSMRNRDKALAQRAKRRAEVLLRHRHRDELREAYEVEYRALAERQGYEEVAVVERSVTVERRNVRRPLSGGAA